VWSPGGWSFVPTMITQLEALVKVRGKGVWSPGESEEGA
jgi:hypothetical protein